MAFWGDVCKMMHMASTIFSFDGKVHDMGLGCEYFTPCKHHRFNEAQTDAACDTVRHDFSKLKAT